MTDVGRTRSDQAKAEQALAELSTWGSEKELNPLDSLMWRTERPPANSWTGVVVQLLSEPPEWERLWAAHEWGTRVVPRFADRVVDPILPTGPPMWSPDPNFDLAHHLRRVTLPAPGSMSQLMELAQTLGVAPLDRNRPPWTAIFVEGLADGRAAYVLQAHHVLMDGAAATQLFSRIFARAPEAMTAARPVLPGHREVGRVGVALHGLAAQAKAAPALAARVVSTVGSVQSDPMGAARGAAKYAASMLRVAKPPPASTSELLAAGPRTAWRFGVLECGLAELKAAGKSVDGTVNDAFVSAVLGGLRGYHERHGVELGDVPISMPVSVRRADDPMGGNRFTGVFFAAPSGIVDPGDRIRAMRERVSVVRGEPALDFINTLTPLMNLAPSAIVAATLTSLTSNAVLTTSSWPGVPFPTYVAGAEFQRMFVFGPLPGTSMCAALCTHVGTCCIGINVDGDVFPDTEVLWECMQEGLDEVLALGVST